MTFFVTSAGKGNGADLGGLEGADAHCNALAKAAGSKRTNWKAYLSTTLPGGDAGVNARERIGKGPWHNAKGVMVAKNVDDLHSEQGQHHQADGADRERRADQGPRRRSRTSTTSSPAPTRRACFSTAGGDTTCGNWTKSGDGSAIVGHHDRQGLKDTLAHEVVELVARLARLQPGPAEGLGRRRAVLLLRAELRLASSVYISESGSSRAAATCLPCIVRDDVRELGVQRAQARRRQLGERLLQHADQRARRARRAASVPFGARGKLHMPQVAPCALAHHQAARGSSARSRLLAVE